EHALRSWVIAARLGDRMGLSADDREWLYYVVMLAWVGCVADTPVVATWFGDDIEFRRAGLGVDRAGLPMLGLALRHVGAGGPAGQAIRPGRGGRLQPGRRRGARRPGCDHRLERADWERAGPAATAGRRRARPGPGSHRGFHGPAFAVAGRPLEGRRRPLRPS